MKIGVVYPQTELDPDPIVVKDFAQTVEDLGFTHILAYEHVLGVDPNRSGGWQGIYSIEDSFMEPFAGSGISGTAAAHFGVAARAGSVGDGRTLDLLRQRGKLARQ